ARIKILVHETGTEQLTAMVEREFEHLKESELKLPESDIRAIEAYFRPPVLPARPEGDAITARAIAEDAGFAAWARRNLHTHRHPDYASVTISLKGIGEVPGDMSAEQMDVVADLADEFAFSEIRVSHEQNLILPHVARTDLK